MSITHLPLGEASGGTGAKRCPRNSGNDLLARRSVEQAHDLRDVIANGEMGQGKLATNLLVRQPLCQEVKDVALSSRQLGKPYEGLFFTGSISDGGRRGFSEPDMQPTPLWKRCTDYSQNVRVVGLDGQVQYRFPTVFAQQPLRGNRVPASQRFVPTGSVARAFEMSQGISIR